MRIAGPFMKKVSRRRPHRSNPERVDVIGLGCGGGQKDTRLLKLLKAGGKEIFYTPCDVSTAMVLTARNAALAVLPAENCFPFVCDLATADDLRKIIGRVAVSATQTILGRRHAVPPGIWRTDHLLRHDSEFRAGTILPKLASLVREEIICCSAPIWPPAPITPLA